MHVGLRIGCVVTTLIDEFKQGTLQYCTVQCDSNSRVSFCYHTERWRTEGRCFVLFSSWNIVHHLPYYLSFYWFWSFNMYVSFSGWLTCCMSQALEFNTSSANPLPFPSSFTLLFSSIPFSPHTIQILTSFPLPLDLTSIWLLPLLILLYYLFFRSYFVKASGCNVRTYARTAD